LIRVKQHAPLTSLLSFTPINGASQRRLLHYQRQRIIIKINGSYEKSVGEILIH